MRLEKEKKHPRRESSLTRAGPPVRQPHGTATRCARSNSRRGARPSAFQLPAAVSHCWGWLLSAVDPPGTRTAIGMDPGCDGYIATRLPTFNNSSTGYPSPLYRPMKAGETHRQYLWVRAGLGSCRGEHGRIRGGCPLQSPADLPLNSNFPARRCRQCCRSVMRDP